MNRIILEPYELDADNRAEITGRRARHMLRVLKVVVGSSVRIGVLDGPTGAGIVESIANESVTLRVHLDAASPPPLFDLLLALPRPKVLKRLWPQLAAIGARRIVLANAYRVERDYFDTHWLTETNYRPLLIEGLEQSGATRLPEIHVRRRIKPFVQDELDTLLPGPERYVGDPNGGRFVPPLLRVGIPVIAVGPEGGWTAFELGLLASKGFQKISLGARVLRSDTGVIALASICAL